MAITGRFQNSSRNNSRGTKDRIDGPAAVGVAEWTMRVGSTPGWKKGLHSKRVERTGARWSGSERASISLVQQYRPSARFVASVGYRQLTGRQKGSFFRRQAWLRQRLGRAG